MSKLNYPEPKTEALAQCVNGCRILFRPKAVAESQEDFSRTPRGAFYVSGRLRDRSAAREGVTWSNNGMAGVITHLDVLCKLPDLRWLVHGITGRRDVRKVHETGVTRVVQSATQDLIP